MSEESLLSHFINILTPKEFRNQCQRHKFSKPQVHRYLTTLSNLDIFAADLVTHIMKIRGFPHIPSIYFGCVGTPPTTWLTGTVLRKVEALFVGLHGLPDVQTLLAMDDLTYHILDTYIGELIWMGDLEQYLKTQRLLGILVLIAVCGTLAYGKGLKKAPTMSVNYIRHVLHVYRLSGVVDDDIYAALMSYDPKISGSQDR